MKRLSSLVVLLIGIGLAATAQSVVASTSWTAAFARLAGADDLTVLAPYDIAHPPEYELRPSDIRRIADADLVIYAGYEVMVPRLREAVETSGAELLQITTVHSWPVIAASVRAIAGALSTSERAEEALATLRRYLDDWAAEVQDSAFADAPVVAHFHQQALAREIGLNVVGVFGPAPLEAQQIRDFTELGPGLIIDNGHNPVAQPLAETTNAPVAVWYNFPGVAETRSLPDVFELNRDALESVQR